MDSAEHGTIGWGQTWIWWLQGRRRGAWQGNLVVAGVRVHRRWVLVWRGGRRWSDLDCVR
jgi:hypothetical protein